MQVDGMKQGSKMSEGEGHAQLLHLLFGGELAAIGSVAFRNPTALHIVGIYPDYAQAYDAWKAQAQKTVDNALMRYFIVHLHRLLDPSADQTLIPQGAAASGSGA